MSLAPDTKNEVERLAALGEFGIDAVLSDPGLNNVLNLAANVFNVPIVLVSLIEAQRQLLAAGLGISVCETSRDVSFCAHAILRRKIMIVPDARLDPRFRDNPMVLGPPYIRFYAGIPLRTLSGYAIGTLCIVDLKPRRSLSARDEHNMQDLAALVMDKLEMRRLELARKASQVRFENIANTSPDSIICVDDKGIITFWNASAEKMLGYSEGQIVGQNIDTIVPSAFISQFNQVVAAKQSLVNKVSRSS